MATQLSRTFASQGNQRKFTISFWVKRTKLSYQCALWGSGGSGNYASSMFFSSDDTLRMWNYFNGSYAGRKYSSAKYRDNNAWYHIVARVDTANSTASERMRVYVNGEEMDYGGQNDNPSQNQTFEIGHTGAHYIGGYGTGAEAELLISHYHYCDGQSYAPTEFGETDSTTGEWKIKTSPSVSYGVSGSFILKDGNSVTDQSGLSNDWTVANGTLTKSEDNPSNVFATFNPLMGRHSNGNNLLGDFSKGNLSVDVHGSAWRISQSTLSASSGKYYAEFKWISDSNTRFAYVGIYDQDNYANKTTGYPYMGDMTNCYALNSENGNIHTGGSSTSYGSAYSTSSIIGVAMDLDNNKLYFSKDGVWMNSANPSNGTGGYSITADKTYTFALSLYCAGVMTYYANFGNGYWGTSTVTSAGTNASGNGIFEYDVPTGYTALSTKGLNL